MKASIAGVVQALRDHGVDEAEIQRFQLEAWDSEIDHASPSRLLLACSCLEWNAELWKVYEFLSEQEFLEEEAIWGPAHDAFAGGDPRPLIDALLPLVRDPAARELARNTRANLPKRSASQYAQSVVAHLLSLAGDAVPPRWLPPLERLGRGKEGRPKKRSLEKWIKRKMELKDRATAYNVYWRINGEWRAADRRIDRDQIIELAVAEVRASGGRVTAKQLDDDLRFHKRRLKPWGW